MSELTLGAPTIEEATLILDEASKLNPGPWRAFIICRQCSRVNC